MILVFWNKLPNQIKNSNHFKIKLDEFRKSGKKKNLRRHFWEQSDELTEFYQFLDIVYNQTGDISTLEGTPLKLVDKFTYLGSSVTSTEKNIDTRLTKAWTAINRLSIIWKSDLTDKMKCSFFQAVVASVLLYGCTTWTLTAGEEARRQLHKNAASNLEQVLAATPHKTPTIRPPAPYHENYSS